MIYKDMPQVLTLVIDRLQFSAEHAGLLSVHLLINDCFNNSRIWNENSSTDSNEAPACWGITTHDISFPNDSMSSLNVSSAYWSFLDRCSSHLHSEVMHANELSSVLVGIWEENKGKRHRGNLHAKCLSLGADCPSDMSCKASPNDGVLLYMALTSSQ